MDGIEFHAASEGGEIRDSQLTTGDLSGRDKISRNRGTVNAAGRDAANVNIYNRDQPLPPRDDAMTDRDFAYIERWIATIEKLTESNYRLNERVARLEEQLRNEIALIKLQVGAGIVITAIIIAMVLFAVREGVL